jgi:hypothetical protein
MAHNIPESLFQSDGELSRVESNDVSKVSRNPVLLTRQCYAPFSSLQRTQPFVNQLHTKLSHVKDIPYFVTDKFLRTYYRDRYQLSQVERMVERQYREYLDVECRKQRDYQKHLKRQASQQKTLEEKERLLKQADAFELSRCLEMNELFPPPKQK